MQLAPILSFRFCVKVSQACSLTFPVFGGRGRGSNLISLEGINETRVEDLIKAQHCSWILTAVFGSDL